jgi:hypothetical protein
VKSPISEFTSLLMSQPDTGKFASAASRPLRKEVGAQQAESDGEGGSDDESSHSSFRSENSDDDVSSPSSLTSEESAGDVGHPNKPHFGPHLVSIAGRAYSASITLTGHVK